jgi:hypothetical protein
VLRSNLICFFVVVISVALCASVVSAEVIVTTADGNGADTLLSNDSQNASSHADAVHGSETTMFYRILADARMRMPYFRFDISSVSGDLSGATLTLELTLNNGNRVRTLTVWGLVDGDGDLWDEATTSYDDAPGILQPADGGVDYESGNYSLDPAMVTNLGTITTPAGIGLMSSTTVNLNLDAFLAADTNGHVSFLFTGGSDSNAQFSFATKENTTEGITFPTLTLPNAVPEPGTIVLLAMGALLLLVYWRRL